MKIYEINEKLHYLNESLSQIERDRDDIDDIMTDFDETLKLLESEEKKLYEIYKKDTTKENAEIWRIIRVETSNITNTGRNIYGGIAMIREGIEHYKNSTQKEKLKPFLLEEGRKILKNLKKKREIE